MKSMSATTRIAICLSSLTVTVLLTGSMVGLFPESRDEVIDGRGNLCEAVAVNFSILAQRGELKAMETSLQVIANRNEDILSIGVRRESGDLLIRVGDHEQQWETESDTNSNETQMFVPVSAGNKRWGTVEFCFRPITAPGFWGIFQTPLISLTLFTGGAGYLIFLIYLRKVLKQLNPSNVVPNRVPALLDTFTDETGISHGALARLDDVTDLKKKEAELKLTIESLRESSDEISKQNRELEQLATRDPMTACFNRRAFYAKFDSIWNAANRYDQEASCIMVDVDHFKSINDNHGHSVGDEVLIKIATVLRGTARESDIVCRYGGEEFAILLPHTSIDDAQIAAERIRVAIEECSFPGFSVTASLGVSARGLGATDPQQLLDQADKCLYVAKRAGRNQVVRWDKAADNAEYDQPTESEPCEDTDADDRSSSIPFEAVAALISTLAYRDQETAEHSRRVADLCVATAEGLMSLTDCYVLETAALLHDIGKIGVPDSILLKPGQLSPDERKIMHTHLRNGPEIIRASFQSKPLSEIVENREAQFQESVSDAGQSTGREIPLGARILAIADAFDSMVSQQVYREARSKSKAFAELRRCAGKQFDPALIERFIQVVELRSPESEVKTNAVSKQTALQIGLQIERLVAALDNQDLSQLQRMAGRLKRVAEKHQIESIAQKSLQLEEAVHSKGELLDVLCTAGELIDLCRETQSIWLSKEDSVNIANDEAALVGN